MCFSSRHSNGRSTCAEVDRRVRRGGGVRVGPTVAQLSLIISSPALQIPVVKDGAGVVKSS